MADFPQASILLLSLPPSCFAGIDLLSFTTSPRFRGIRNLPPGPHFVFTSTTNDVSIRHGVWFRVQEARPDDPPELFIKKWDASREVLVEETDQAEVLRWRANLGSIWREGLTPYRQSGGFGNGKGGNDDDDAVEEKQDWASLTTYITDALLSRITGGTRNHWALTSTSSASRDLDDIPGLSKSEIPQERELQFLPIDLKQTWRQGATGRERTDAARDRSWALDNLIARYCVGEGKNGEEDVLGEVQFCFLMVLTLNNYSCLEQWKRLLSLLLTCQRAVLQRSKLYLRLLPLIKLQLQHCKDAEDGLFDLSDEGGSLLRQLLGRFRQSLELQAGSVEKVDILEELEELEGFLREEHGWQMGDVVVVRRGLLQLEDGEQVEIELGGYEEEDESGEYAPTVVELTDNQIKALGADGEESGGGRTADGRDIPSAHTMLDEDSKGAVSQTVDDENDEEEEDAHLEELDVRY